MPDHPPEDYRLSQPFTLFRRGFFLFALVDDLRVELARIARALDSGMCSRRAIERLALLKPG